MCNLRGAIRVRISLVQENNCTEGRELYAQDYGDRCQCAYHYYILRLLQEQKLRTFFYLFTCSLHIAENSFYI